MAFADTADLAVRLSLDNQFSRGMATASRSLSKFEGDMRKVGRGTGQLARGAVRAGAIVGTAVVGGLALAAREAINFEDAFQGVVKTVDEADLKSAGLTFEDLSDSIRKMSLEMPIAATELAGIAEQAGALGIKAKDIESFTKQVALLSTTTDVTAEDAATALGQLQNAIGLSGDEFDNFAAALVDLGNKGASTESKILEVTGRIGAAGKQIGLTKAETLAWGAALANLPDLPELAGTAGQMFFGETQIQVAKGGEKLRELARVAGTTAKEFKKAFRTDASGALKSFLAGLTELTGEERIVAIQNIFGKRTGLTRIINELADSMDQNLNPALANSDKAWREATAAQIEFDKRNRTVRSSITRFRNALIDAAVTLGEGMAPAIGRAADTLSNFLRQDENRQQLKDLGEDIGRFIDNIDWNEVVEGGKTLVDVMRTAGDMGLRLLGIISKLPKEVLAVGGGALLLNKISGGLLGAGVGNIGAGLIGAALKSALATIPVFGRAFVQPVFVTNMPLGGLGGGDLLGTAAKGIGIAGLAAIAVSVAAAAGIVAVGGTVANAIDPTALAPGTTPLGARDPARFDKFGRVIANSIKTGFESIDRPRTAGPTADAAARAARAAERQAEATRAGAFGSGGDVTTSIEKLKAASAKDLGNVRTGIDNAARLSAETTGQVQTQIQTEGSMGRSTTLLGATIGASATNVQGAAIVGGLASVVAAIWGARPIINVSATSVTNQSTVVQRFGPSGGSRSSNGGTWGDPDRPR